MSARATKTTRSIDAVITQISEKAGMVAVGFLCIMVMLTVTDVVLRTLFDRTIVYMFELTEYTMLVVVYFGLSWCALNGRHLKADLIVRMFPEKAQDIQAAINHFIVICVSALVAVQSFRLAFAVKEFGDASELTRIPYWPFYFIVVFGSALLFLVMITMFIHAVHKVIKK